MSYRKDTSGIDAIRLGEIGNQVFDKADIINKGVRSSRCPCWIRFEPFSVPVHVYRNAVRVQRSLAQSSLRLDVRCSIAIPGESQYQWRCMVGLVVLGNMDCVIAQ